MQTLAQKIRKTQQKCKPCKDEDLQADAQQCLKQVCQKAKKQCQEKQQGQQKQKSCERKKQCQKHQKGKPIKVSDEQVQYGCKRDIDAYNKCVEKKQQCDLTKVVQKHRKQHQRTPSGGIGLW